MTNIKRIKNALIIFILILSIFIIGNINVSIRQGIDGHYRSVYMPLYVKWTQFLARHYEYARLSSDITKGCKTDEAKVLAILDWTRHNIKDVPAGFSLVDDHILTIIVKGYGSPAQHQDVFTALCAYSNIPAFWRTIYDSAHRSKYYLSFVRINGKWCVFDAYNVVYFRNKTGGIASVEDIIADESLIGGYNYDRIKAGGLSYKDFYRNLTPVEKPWISRPEKQMPIPRIMYEGAKALRLTREDDDL